MQAFLYQRLAFLLTSRFAEFRHNILLLFPIPFHRKFPPGNTITIDSCGDLVGYHWAHVLRDRNPKICRQIQSTARQQMHILAVSCIRSFERESTRNRNAYGYSRFRRIVRSSFSSHYRHPESRIHLEPINRPPITLTVLISYPTKEQEI